MVTMKLRGKVKGWYRRVNLAWNILVRGRFEIETELNLDQITVEKAL